MFPLPLCFPRVIRCALSVHRAVSTMQAVRCVARSVLQTSSRSLSLHKLHENDYIELHVQQEGCLKCFVMFKYSVAESIGAT